MNHLESQLREMYGRVAYTHKTHEKMADIIVAKYTRIKTLEVWLSAIGTGSLVFAVFGESHTATIIGAFLSTVLLGLVLYFKEATLGEHAQLHSETAARLWGLRERLLSLLIDHRSGVADLVVSERRDAINESLEKLYKSAPRTTARAYKLAQDALKENQELYFSHAELDRLLPPELREGR